MTAADGARLTRLDPSTWVDADDIVSLHIRDSAKLEFEALIALRHGSGHTIQIPGTYVGPATNRTLAQARANAEVWLLDHFGADLLEGIDYATTTGEPR